MKKYVVTVNGKAYEVEVEEVQEIQESYQAKPVIEKAPVEIEKPKAPIVENIGSKKVASPMPGTILKILVKVGDLIKAGDSILVLEAMKMENDISASEDCIISSINVSQGQSVDTGDVLVTYR